MSDTTAARVKNEIDLATMQYIRDCFNPKRLANPGKIFPAPRTCGEAAIKLEQFPDVEAF